MIKSSSNIDQILTRTGQILVKNWSKTSQILIKYWSKKVTASPNTDQNTDIILTKNWSNTDLALIEKGLS